MQRLCSIVALIVAILLTALAQASAPFLGSSAEVERRANSILNQMTLEEKLDLLGGVDDFFIRDIPGLTCRD